MKWAIQTTHTNAGMANELAGVVSACGHQPVPVWLEKNATELPEIDCDIQEPVIFYGSTRLVALAAQTSYRPGSFFFPGLFDSQLHIDLNGPFMLNSGEQRMKLGDALNLSPGFFIKPIELKRFTGMPIRNDDDLSKLWADDLMMDVAVSPLKRIVWEARCFMLDGKVIDAAQYRPDRRRVSDYGLAEISAYLACATMPTEACVADVARMENGSLKIVEFNCFSSSGFYEHHDMTKIVTTVSDRFSQ